MQVRIEKKLGKIISGSDKLKDCFSTLDDGGYVISIDKINPLITPKDYQKAYFSMLDTCVRCTGNARYVIHDEFKKFSEIQTTTNLDVIGWRKILDKLKWWAYDKFDCIV